jgi:hypothetical protein
MIYLKALYWLTMCKLTFNSNWAFQKLRYYSNVIDIKRMGH